VASASRLGGSGSGVSKAGGINGGTTMRGGGVARTVVPTIPARADRTLGRWRWSGRTGSFDSGSSSTACWLGRETRLVTGTPMMRISKIRALWTAALSK
jgi:hypothetical protein